MRLLLFVFACLLSTSLPVTAAAQSPVTPLSKVEQQIRDYVRSHQAEQIDFLEKAVNISSGTFNLAGVREVGRLFEPQFSALGFQVSWVALPDAVGRAGHLFAERKGTKGKRLILLGHLDTVFEGDGERFVRRILSPPALEART
jgi:glutamate carboxypeptidase